MAKNLSMQYKMKVIVNFLEYPPDLMLTKANQTEQLLIYGYSNLVSLSL